MTEKILETMEAALEMPKGSITLESSSTNVEAWDSLGQLSILIALDKLFAGKISSIGEMATADSVQKVLKLLQQNSLI